MLLVVSLRVCDVFPGWIRTVARTLIAFEQFI